MKTPVVIVLLMALISPLTASAVSYSPHLYPAGDRGEIFMKGDEVYLFHSGTEEIKRIIHLNDILAVYRTNPSGAISEVGRIRIISFIGEMFLKGEVIEGELRSDDIARKGSVSCLVISAGICDYSQ